MRDRHVCYTNNIHNTQHLTHNTQHNLTDAPQPLNDITPMRMLMIAPHRDSNRAILRALLPHVDIHRKDSAGWSYLHFLAARFDTSAQSPPSP